MNPPFPSSQSQKFHSPGPRACVTACVSGDLRTAPASCAILELLLGICCRLLYGRRHNTTTAPGVQFEALSSLSTNLHIPLHPALASTSSQCRSLPHMASPPETLSNGRLLDSNNKWVDNGAGLYVGHALSSSAVHIPAHARSRRSK